MKIGLGSVAAYVFAIGFVVLPVMAALAVQLLSGAGTSAHAKPYFLILAVVAIVAGVSFLERMRRRQRRRAGQASRPSAAQEELRLAALGIGGFVVAESFIVAAIDWRVAAGYLCLAGLWVLVWTPRANRTVLMRSAVKVRCSPRAAFDLVSNPNNWPLYVPEIELAQPVEVPVSLGTVIHDRVRREGKIAVEADEEVVALEPGVRFGTAIQMDPQRSSGTYEFEPVDGGTIIEYTSRSLLSLPAAVFGIALRRAAIVSQMSERRKETLARIKQLLEEPGSSPV